MYRLVYNMTLKLNVRARLHHDRQGKVDSLFLISLFLTKDAGGRLFYIITIIAQITIIS